jgi:hypothetical protein
MFSIMGTVGIILGTIVLIRFLIAKKHQTSGD